MFRGEDSGTAASRQQDTQYAVPCTTMSIMLQGSYPRFQLRVYL